MGNSGRGTDETQREDLLLRLHRGAFDEPHWQGLLRALRQQLSLSYANLIFRHGRSGRSVLAEFSDGRTDLRAHRARYRSSFAALDPFPYHRMEPGRSYRVEELLGTVTPAEHPFYRDFLVPAGLARMLSARVVEPSGYVAWLTICRDEQDPDFTSAEQQLFDSLLPHMDIALHAFAVIERHKVHSAIARHLAARLDFAALAVTKEGEVLAAGPRADAIVQQSDVFAIGADSRLRLNDAPAQRRLVEAIRAAANGQPSKAFLVRSNNEQVELLVSPFSSASAYGSARPDAVIYLRHRRDAKASDDVRARLIEMFGLTQVECDIAQGLARGRTMGQLAQELGLTENTVRSYSKSIYVKLGVRRQVDLVRLMLHSVALLA